jgi:hypothetical protein
MKMQATNYTLTRLTKKAIKFEKDLKEGTVSVSSLDNIMEFMLLIEGLFDISNKAKEGIDDILLDCLLASDKFKPDMDDESMSKRIHNIRIDVIGLLREEKIDIF